jgi:hypothetical protein
MSELPSDIQAQRDFEDQALKLGKERDALARIIR